MRRFNPELLSGAAMLVVVVLVAAPVLFWGVSTLLPFPVWVSLFVVMVASLVLSIWELRRSRWQHGAFAVAVLSAGILVLGGTGQGLLPVLLVLTAAIAPYVVPLWAGFAVIAVNVVVLIASMSPLVGVEADPMEVLIVGGFYLLIQAASMFSSMSLLREQRAKRELAEAHIELQSAGVLLAESARTAERLRISRELHDLIGHQLTVLALELEAAKHRDREGQAGEHIHRAAGVARDLLQSVRTTVGELRIESADLRTMLQGIVQDLPEPRVTLDVDEDITLDELHTTLFVRAVQEIVTNTIRHADSQTLHLEVRSTPEGMTLISQDDGRGTVEVRLGNGLRGLRERFEQLGGEVAYTSAANDGFRVTASVPSLSRARTEQGTS